MYKYIRKFFAQEVVNDRAHLAEEIIFGKGNSETDKAIADSVANLAEAFCKTKSPGFVDAGVFVFLKHKDEDGEFRIFAKRLTTKERIALNNNNEYFSDPEKMLEVIAPRKISNQFQSDDQKKISSLK